MRTQATITSAILLVALVSTVSAFAPRSTNVASTMTFVKHSTQLTPLKMAVFDDGERKTLTRESEPEEYFQTNTDKMSDEEKIPIALMGLAGISLPFLLGLIALYAAK